MRQLFHLNRLLLTFVACLLAASAFAAGKFDHFTTGFPLSGGHAQVDCASCHPGGMFRGTPDRCVACHGPGGFVSASTKPQGHILSSNRCETCHTPARWNIGIRTDHSAVTGSCISCHNGRRVAGKNARHVTSSNDCMACHNTITWMNARFDHSGVTAGCNTCHGVTATGKPARHILTTAQCDVCHTTRAWSDIHFDHSGATGSCASCHNGTNATGKSASHTATTADCSVCHSTANWNFSHGGGSGTCSNCHDGRTATGKSGGHFVTTRECSACHNTSNWTSVSYSHTGYYPNHSGFRCTQCHGGNSEAITNSYWATYPRTCAGCHAGSYRTGDHRSVPVSTNRDCSRCHNTRDW